MDFSGSNIDDGFDSVKERSSNDGGWIILVFSHVNDLKIVWSGMYLGCRSMVPCRS